MEAHESVCVEEVGQSFANIDDYALSSLSRFYNISTLLLPCHFLKGCRAFVWLRFFPWVLSFFCNMFCSPLAWFVCMYVSIVRYPANGGLEGGVPDEKPCIEYIVLRHVNIVVSGMGVRENQQPIVCLCDYDIALMK